MKLILYNNFSEKEKLNKSIVKIIELNGTLRESSSLINPSITIELNPNTLHDYIVDDDKNYVMYNGIKITWNSFIYNYVLSVNYCYIEEFNRYYYVENPISVCNNVWRLVMHVDVLMSYNKHIKELDALVERNEFRYYDSIEDNKMPYEFYQDVTEINVTDESELDFDTSIADGCFAISFINDSTNNNHTILYPPVSCLPKIQDQQIGSNVFNKYGIMEGVDVRNLASQLYNNESQLSYITSLISFPFEIPHTNDYKEDLRLGSTDYTGIEVFFNKSGNNTISPYYKVASIDFNNYFTGNYMDYEPYSKYELYLPFYDYVELKSADIKDSVVNVYYSFDYTNGLGRINIVNITKNYVIKSVEFNIGVKISINRNNLQQLQDERTQLGIKTALSGLGSVASIVGGSVTGNALLVAGGVMGLTNTAIDLGTKLSMQHERASGSNNGGINSVYTCREVRLKITKYVKREPYDYAHYYGKPLNENVKLGELSGYTLIKDIHINNIGSITSTEFDELYSLLTNGIIL